MTDSFNNRASKTTGFLLDLDMTRTEPVGDNYLNIKSNIYNLTEIILNKLKVKYSGNVDF